MTERSLFNEDDPRKPLPHNGTATSKLAASTMRQNATSQEVRVFEFIQAQGERGATDEEIQTALDMTGNSQRPRRGRLVERGHVADSLNMRMTRSGRPATVWVAVSIDQPPVAQSKADWPTDGKSNPNKADSVEAHP